MCARVISVLLGSLGKAFDIEIPVFLSVAASCLLIFCFCIVRGFTIITLKDHFFHNGFYTYCVGLHHDIHSHTDAHAAPQGAHCMDHAHGLAGASTVVGFGCGPLHLFYCY